MLSDALIVGAEYWFGAPEWVHGTVTITVRASALPGLVIWAVHRLRRGRETAE